MEIIGLPAAGNTSVAVCLLTAMAYVARADHTRVNTAAIDLDEP